MSIKKKRRAVPYTKKINMEKLLQYMDVGLTDSEMATKLNVSQRTITRYKKEIAEKIGKELTKKNINQLIGELISRSRRRTKQLWSIAVNTEMRGGSRVAALRALQKEDQEFIRKAQMLGILPRDTPAVMVETGERTEYNLNVLQVMDEAMKKIEEEGRWDPKRPLVIKKQ